jgi:hypothetical protein
MSYTNENHLYIETKARNTIKSRICENHVFAQHFVVFFLEMSEAISGNPWDFRQIFSENLMKYVILLLGIPPDLTGFSSYRRLKCRNFRTHSRDSNWEISRLPNPDIPSTCKN